MHLYSIKHTFIKRKISLQSTPMLKCCIFTCLIWQRLPSVMIENDRLLISSGFLQGKRNQFTINLRCTYCVFILYGTVIYSSMMTMRKQIDIFLINFILRHVSHCALLYHSTIQQHGSFLFLFNSTSKSKLHHNLLQRLRHRQFFRTMKQTKKTKTKTKTKTKQTKKKKKNAVCVLQINCKLPSFALDKSCRNKQTINSLS